MCNGNVPIALASRLMHCMHVIHTYTLGHVVVEAALQATDKSMQQRVAVALAWLGKEADLRQCFVDRRGLDVLLDMLTDQRRDASVHKEAASRCSIWFSGCMSSHVGKFLQS